MRVNMKIKSLCGCVSYNVVTVPYPYTHPVRPDNIGLLDIRKHEMSCENAQSIKASIDAKLVQQTLDSVSDASTPNNWLWIKILDVSAKVAIQELTIGCLD